MTGERMSSAVGRDGDRRMAAQLELGFDFFLAVLRVLLEE